MRRCKYVLVSYQLEDDIPIFKGNQKNQIESLDSFESGQTWNSFSMKLFNHNGTHIDGPFHFDRKGKRLAEHKIDQFIFQKPFVADIPKVAGEAITAHDLSMLPEKVKSCDLLLIKTGFFAKRKQLVYTENNPWLDPSAADYIRKKYTKFKAIGIDTISIASSQKLAEGRLSHQILLKKRNYKSSPIMIIEDLNLSVISDQIKSFYAIPLLIKGIDSSPCTAFAEV